MKRKLVLVFFALLASHVLVYCRSTPGRLPKQFSTAGFYAIPGSPRKVYNFNPGWRFFKGQQPEAKAAAFNDAAWELANLPHGLEIEGENASGMRNYQGPAWYRKSFRLPAGSTDRHWVLYFEGVMGKTTVWVNGRMVMEHFGGYLPFSADITSFLNKDNRDEQVAVFTDNSDDPSYPPGKPQDALDFTYLGGIYRDVYLIETAPVHVTFTEQSTTTAGGGVFVAVKDVGEASASLEVRTELVNQTTAPVRVTVRSTLEDAAYKEMLVTEKTVVLAAGASIQLAQAMEPKKVHLWHPDDPVLHFIKTEIISKGRVEDSYRTRFGIRLFEMRGDQGFFVNKRYIGHKLSGVNRHQDYVYVGNALPNSGQWRDAKLLREGGCDIVRAAHYPLDPAFMDACDELGLLVTVATPGWQFFNASDPRFEQRIAADVRNMVRRDRNRPAVLLWETALNETDDQTISMMKNLHAITHSEFPFPGAFTVADVDKAKLAGFDFYYHGGMEEDKCSFTREYGDGGEVENFYSQNAMTRVKREWGEQAMLGQALVRAKGLSGIYSTPPKRIGAAIWCGIDHQRGYHPDPFWGGLLDVYRMPRYAYYLFKSQYSPAFRLTGIDTGPMVYITHELTQVSGSDVVVFSNCDEVRLTWLGKRIAVNKPDTAFPYLPHAPFIFRNVFNYHDISRSWRGKSDSVEMIAEGLIGGKVVCKQVKRYAERTTGIRLEIDSAGIGLTADGADFVPVRATVIDNKGIPKVLASEEIHFEVSGDASLIGGDRPGINPMKTQFGTATILVRAGLTPGPIQVRAFAAGLKSDALQITSSPPQQPLLFSQSFYTASKHAADNAGKPVSFQYAGSADAEKLKQENEQLRRQMTAKEQEIMEMRSRLKN
jgi:beta-galactosidase